MGKQDSRVGDERRQRMPLPAALKDDLGVILGDVLVMELREEDASQVQKATVEPPGGTDHRKGKGVKGEVWEATETE